MCTKAEQIPVGRHVPQHFQQDAHIGSSGELFVELVAAVCELDVYVQLHQASHLHTQIRVVPQLDERRQTLCSNGHRMA